MVKSFRAFDKQQQRERSRRRKQYQNILFAPVHGGHASPKKEVKEAYGDHGPAFQHLGSYLDAHENHHLGNHLEEVHSKLDHKLEDWQKHPQKDHLFKYSTNSADLNRYHINKASGQALSHQESEHEKYTSSRHEEHTKHLDKALKKSKLKHDLHVYHGLKGWHPGDEARKGNGHIRLPSYTSTSIDKSIAANFANTADHRGEKHILHIHMKKGQHGHYLGSHSDFSNEKEMLLPRGTILKVHPKSTKHGSVRVWHATVHHQDHGHEDHS